TTEVRRRLEGLALFLEPLQKNPRRRSEDKFKFVLQAASPGTRARELIDSYPTTAENYPNVVGSLKQRFGREDLLVEVHVRELLRFVLHNETNPKEKVPVSKKDLPTAAGLFNSENHSMKSQSYSAIRSTPAKRWLFRRKRVMCRRNKCCFYCPKAGHMSKDCKLQVRCIICGHKHYPVMCTDLPRKNEAAGNSGGEGVTKVAAMSNISSATELLLKTLIVKIQFGGNVRLTRVDAGSHRSYILKDVAETMNLNQIGTDSMIHAIFGRVNSDPVTHIQYEVPVSNLDGTYCCPIKLLDQSTICTAIPKVPRGPRFGELKQRKIWISDVETDCKSVDILFAADAIGRIKTGQVRHLKCVLIAVKTKLGWTLMGEVPRSPREERPALVVTSLLNSPSCITSLWQLEAIGITDPAETSTREELERSAKDLFLSTVSDNQEERYQVHLPWIDGHPGLGPNLAIVEKTLGPNLIGEILPLLIRFREKRIGVVSDIARAFLQISVAERDRNFLRFLWWEGDNAKKIVALRHRRVVFGVSSSPFLVGAVIEFHLNRAPAHLEETARILRKSFYVDNCVSCVDTEEQLDSLISESQGLFALGKFDLRGWEYTLFSSTKPEETPVLGLLWDRSEDSLRCDLNKLRHLQAPVTKRKVLSIAQQIFDPAGFLCPVTLQPKKVLKHPDFHQPTHDEGRHPCKLRLMEPTYLKLHSS
ncbi:unnamed protein product, partial [Allacma fusca]